MTGRTRLGLASLLAGALACGPKAAPPRDVQGALEKYCEFIAITCPLDPEASYEYCIEIKTASGIYEGSEYDEIGCLDYALDIMECVTTLTCEEYQEWTSSGREAGPCGEAWRRARENSCFALP